MLAEQFARKLAGVSVAGHTADTIGFQQRREVIDHRIRRERRAGLANGIDDNPVLGLVRDCQREAVIGAAARISESSVKVVCGRQHLAIVAGAGFDDFECDKALDVRAELREILRRRAGAVGELFPGEFFASRRASHRVAVFGFRVHLCRDRQRDHERGSRYLELSLHEPGNYNLHGISEHRLQASVIEHLSQNAARDVFWFATPNAARRSPHLGLRMKNEGLTAGVADLCILLPQGRAAWLEDEPPGAGNRSCRRGLRPAVGGCSIPTSWRTR